MFFYNVIQIFNLAEFYFYSWRDFQPVKSYTLALNLAVLYPLSKG